MERNKKPLLIALFLWEAGEACWAQRYGNIRNRQNIITKNPVSSI
jgi:hypothetical protein